MHATSIDLLMTRNIQSVEGGFAWAYDDRLQLPSRLRLTEEHTLAFLRGITCPTLLVRASDGLRMSQTVEEQRMSAIQNLHVEQVPGRHHVHMDDPMRVAVVLQPFLAPLR